MPKKLSERQKRNIVESFTNGETIVELSEKYQITKATITRYLKKEVELDIFKSLVKKSKNNQAEFQKDNKNLEIASNKNDSILEKTKYQETIPIDQSFIEITPLDCDIDNTAQKDLASLSIDEIDLPKVVYMIVDNKIELETKILKEYPDWHFLSQNELNRTTIEIYFDLKTAKRFCKKEQKVIKIPDVKVFSIAAPFLVSRGITRIVSPDKLIAL